MKCKKILTALLAAACTMSGCHGDLDIMQDNKLSASNMWIDESDAETATYGIYLYMRDASKTGSLCSKRLRLCHTVLHADCNVFEQRLCRLERHV